MILVTGGAGFIGANFSSGVTRWRALACTEMCADTRDVIAVQAK
jgi:nucleoside-diphosphate-sugar epimerase